MLGYVKNSGEKNHQINSVIKWLYGLQVPRHPELSPVSSERKGEIPEIPPPPEPPSSKIQEPKRVFSFEETYLGTANHLTNKGRRWPCITPQLPSNTGRDLHPPDVAVSTGLATRGRAAGCRWKRRERLDRPGARRQLMAAWLFLWPLTQAWVLV